MKSLLPKILLAVLATLLLVEGILWLFLRQGWEPEISIDYWQDFPGLQKEITFEKNALGLRSLSIDEADKPDGVIRVLCIGASTTEQGTHSTKDMWQAELERLVNAALPKGSPVVQVGAYAKGGSKMHETMRWARLRLSELEPDVVVTLFGINSLVTDTMFQKVLGWEGMEAWIEAAPPLWPDRLANFSQAARYSRNISANALRMRMKDETKGLNFDVMGVASFRQNYWGTPIATEEEASISPRLFGERTDYLLGWLKSEGIRPVVLGQPLLLHEGMNYVERAPGDVSITGLQPGVTTQEEAKAIKDQLGAIWFVVNVGNRKMARILPGQFRAQMTRFNHTQRDVAATHDVPYVPLDELIAPNLDNFFDDCHFTDKGSDRVAAAMLPAVLSQVEKVIAEQQKEPGA